MTITTLRPTAIFNAAVGVTSTGGALPTIWNDNSDASYATGNVANGYVGVAFTTGIALFGSRVYSTQLRCRCSRSNSNPGLQQATLSLMNTASGVVIPPAFLAQRVNGTPLTLTGPLYYTAPGGGAFSDASIDFLGVFVNFNRDQFGAANFLRIYEIYLDVDTRAQPIVSGAPSVTGTTDNARPTTSWVFTDADSQPQYGYQVKIFDSLTYSGGGFNPDTSKPVVDSGVIKAGDSSWQSNGDLQNGVTYQSYVRAGVAWPTQQGLGDTWYSPWAVSAPYTIAFTAPPAPTFTLQAMYDGAANLLNLLQVSTPLNLLYGDESSFEGNTLGGWVPLTNIAVSGLSVSSADASHGTRSMQMSSIAAGNMAAITGFDLVGDPAVKGGAQYTALGSFKAAVSARSCNIGIRWIDHAGAAIGADVTGANVSDGTGGYVQASVSATAPGNAVQAKVIATVLATGGAAELHRADAFSFHAGAATSFVPGYYLSQNPGLIVERGERCSNRRGPAENWAHPQVASAGSLLENAGYGFNVDLSRDYLYWEPLNKSIIGRGNFPLGMLHWMPRGTPASNTALRIGTWYYAPESEWNFPVYAGNTHTGSFWAWCGAATFLTTVKIEWLDIASQLLSTTTFSAVTLSTTPQQLALSATAPAGAVQARMVMQNDNSSNSADVYLTRVGWGLGGAAVDHKPAVGGPITWIPTRFPRAAASLSGFPAGFGQAGQVVPVPDYECPPGRPLLYRARYSTTSSATGQQISSPYSAVSSVLNAPPAAAILLDPLDPDTSITVNRRHLSALSGKQAMQHKWDEDSNVYHPLGRDGDAVRVRDWIGGEDGELLALTNNEAQAERLRSLMLSPNTLLIVWAQGGQTYVNILARLMAEELHYFGWCDVDGGVAQISPYLRYDLWTLSYTEASRP